MPALSSCPTACSRCGNSAKQCCLSVIFLSCCHSYAGTDPVCLSIGSWTDFCPLVLTEPVNGHKEFHKVSHHHHKHKQDDKGADMIGMRRMSNSSRWLLSPRLLQVVNSARCNGP